ncbi:Neurochondrin family isoform 2 [Chlorella sorokiniana]|uniref:Neurochondrin family isoform 2 n=1 Tax=Chlorella sorokiniana TaxID=3076 RepID=A0A2P6TLB8_CHLSO|nr:Neurochondrin family isoform 2 [Chlorella sorokiniana]|eukprot:PRW45088.1 Neurochondrin family isoform 2 [Chlorella sorokiniana]
MRPGFLVPQPGAEPADRAQQPPSKQCTATAAAAAHRPAQAAAASGAPPPQRTPEQLSAGLAECLELLKGPADERRFVGLLLVTKLLPAGDDATIRAVHAAVGPTFLSRLLLPLSTRAPPLASSEAAQKAAASCALGLAVLSSFVRVPDLAVSSEVLEKLPLLLNVTQQLSLALQLMAALLADEGRRAEVQADAHTVLGQLLPALARAFGLPAQQLRSGSSRQGKAAGQQADRQLQERLLAVQLEALHVLLLLLPLPHAADLPPEQLAGTGGSAAWLAQLRQGLALLLRGRVSAVQRHSALQLAAAVVDLVGPDWLLGAGGSGGSASGSSGSSSANQKAAAAEDQAFFQLLVEITKVETSVLLHDALAPDVPVPLASAAGASAADWRPPAPRRPAGDACSSGGSEAGDGLDEVGAELAADLAEAEEGSQAADMEPLVRVLHSEEDRLQLEAQLQREQQAAQAAADAAAAAVGGSKPREQMRPGEHMKQVDEVQIPADMRWEGPTEAAGARAARVLPACFALLEACIESLAADTQRAEAMVDAGAPATAALSDAVAQRALFSLQEAVEVVLQFIEQTCEEVAEEEQQAEEVGMTAGATAALVRRSLLLAALRALARFCAEVPEAFGGRLRPLLPALLPLWADLGGTADAEGAGSPAEGAAFLLPLLLQVSEPGYGEGGEQQAREHQLWLQALGEPAVLCLLARYAQQCAAACAQVSTSAADSAADDALFYACQLLLNVTGSQQPATSMNSSSGASADARRQLAAAAAAGPLLSGLVQVAAHRGEALSSSHSSPDQVVHAARLLTTIVALASSLAAQLAADLPPGQQAQQLLPLGPLSSQLMTSLCGQLLTALHGAAALLAPEPLSHRLSAGLGVDAATLAAASSWLPLVL